MLTLFVSAFFLGLIFNAAPGVVFAETVRQGVRGGYHAAFAVQIGSLVGDAVWAVLGLIGVGLLLQLEALRWPVGVAGVAYLLWLAWDSWKSASHEFSVEPANVALSERKAMKAGAILSLTNPQNIAYWAAMGSAMGAVGVAQPAPADYAVFFAGFMVSSILWCFVCAAIVDKLFRNAGARWARMTYRLCAAAFLALALGSLRDLMTSPAAQGNQAPSAVVGKP